MRVFLFALLTALLWGLAPVFDKLGLGKATPMTALSIRTIFIAVGLTVFLAISGGWREFHSVDRQSVIYLALGGLAAGLVGQLAYYSALRCGGVGTVSPITATYPLVAVILSILFLREPITPGKVVGAILIVLGVLLIRLDNTLWPR